MTLDYQSVTFFIGLAGAVFTVYNIFRKPQEDMEKRQAVSEKEGDGNAALLRQRMDWEKENNAQKFSELQINMKDAMTLAQNHTHTVDVKVDNLIEAVRIQSIEIAKLGTIIDERLPRKKNG